MASILQSMQFLSSTRTSSEQFVTHRTQVRTYALTQKPYGEIGGIGSAFDFGIRRKSDPMRVDNGRRSFVEEKGRGRRAQMRGGAVKGSSQSPSADVLRKWREADAVCFDVDSTLCEDESIDELAGFLGFKEQVEAMTSQAMGGTVLFQDSLNARLSLISPSKDDIRKFLERNPPRLSKGIPELIRRLHELKKEVFLVSGGFRVIINPIAKILNIPLDNVYANQILHKDDGTYLDFDRSEKTSRSGGKRDVILHLKKSKNFDTVVMVGDGATDLEARQPGGADIFIGYGGVQTRSVVKENADWYIYDIQDLIESLKGAERK